MSNNLTPYSITDAKPNIKAGLTAMINEYNNISETKEKLKYMDSVMEWYMREKSIHSISKNNDSDNNKYTSNSPYSRS